MYFKLFVNNFHAKDAKQKGSLQILFLLINFGAKIVTMIRKLDKIL